MQDGVRARAHLLARAFLLLLLLYSGLRGLFLVLHGELFQDHPAGALLGAFIRGLRFDLSAIAFSNIPVIFMALAPAILFRKVGYRRLLKGVFVGVNSFFVCVMVADLEYFNFTGTRATFDLLQLTTEATGQLHQLLLSYAPLTLLAAFLTWGLYRLYPAHEPRGAGAMRLRGDAQGAGARGDPRGKGGRASSCDSGDGGRRGSSVWRSWGSGLWRPGAASRRRFSSPCTPSRGGTRRWGS